MIQEKIEITADHLRLIREKYDCKGMDDNMIIAAMLRYEKRFNENGSVWLIEYICFPNFQCYLQYFKTIKI